MRNPFISSIAALGAIAIASSASAATTLLPGGDIRLAGGWDNGLPSTTNPATISLDGILGDSDTFGFGAGTVIDHSAGTIDAVAGTRTGFNMNGGATWNMSGGKIVTRYFLANGLGNIINLSGGLVELGDVAGTQHMGVANSGVMNISGSVVLDGTQASGAPVQTGGTIDIASDWAGSWTWGLHSGTDWKDLVTTNAAFKLDGAAIDAGTFDANFQVTDGGKTLSMVPEPAVTGLLAFGLAGLLIRRRRN